MQRNYTFLVYPLIFVIGLFAFGQFSVSYAASPAAPLAQTNRQTTTDGQEYVVQSGDSLYEIAGRFYGNPNAFMVIVEATNAKAAQDKRFTAIKDPRFIQVGQRLWIPNTPSLPITQPAPQQPTPKPVTATVAGAMTSSGAPSIKFVEPQNGATVPPQFAILLAAQGVILETAGELHENAGHLHILVDKDFVEAGELIPRAEGYIHYWRGEITGTLELTPGLHTLRLQFSDSAHIALDGPQYRDTITVTVAEDPAAAPRVRFVAPINGAVVPPNFMVTMAAQGMIVEPAGEIHENAGHFHILVDTDFVSAGEVIINDPQHLHYGKAQLTTTLALEPGVHLLRLQFANGAHIALDGPQYQDIITVTVAADAPTEPGVHIYAPQDGATVPPKFDIAMIANGLIVEAAGELHENAGHFHILVDTDFVEAGEIIPRAKEYIHYWQGQVTGTVELPPGVHTLRLQFSDSAHVALEGAQYRDTIMVTVAEDAPLATGVRFVTPATGATVPSAFEVEMAAQGMVVEPAGEIHENAGHFHILIDTDFIPAGEVIINDAQHLHYGKAQMTTTITLEPGVHTLRLQFANGAHIALEGPQYQDTITVTVEAENADGAMSTTPQVRFLTPTDGATVAGAFDVVMQATGMTVEPAGEIHENAGHFHILVDTDFVPAGEIIINDEQHLHYGKGQAVTKLTLPPGKHTLRLQFANGAHIALDGEQYQDEITVTVGK